MKNLVSTFLILLMITLASEAMAQSKEMKKYQAEREYPAYQKNAHKNSKKTMNAYLRDAKQSNKAAKVNHRRNESLNRKRAKISSLSGS